MQCCFFELVISPLFPHLNSIFIRKKMQMNISKTIKCAAPRIGIYVVSSFLVLGFLFFFSFSNPSFVYAEMEIQELNLFIASDEVLTEPLPVTQNKPILRSRMVMLNTDLLKEVCKEDQIPIFFNLFTDVALEGIVNDKVIRSARNYTLFGSIDDDPNSYFAITMHEGIVSGGIRTGDNQHYEIDYAGGSLYQLCEIDEAEYSKQLSIQDVQSHQKLKQRELSQAKVLSQANSDEGNLDIASDEGSTVDIMIMYTPLARSKAGSDEAMGAAIDRAIDEMNLCFKNSAISTRLRLVHYMEIPFTEHRDIDGNWEDHDDRWMMENSIETILYRDQYKADLVCFFTQGIGSGVRNWPFSLVGWHSATSGGFLFAHEVGHNFGGHHAVGDSGNGSCPGLDRTDGGTCPSYGHGWNIYVGGQRYTTVMAYHQTMCNQPGTGIKIPYYSNPNVMYKGAPTGNPIGHPDESFVAKVIEDNSYNMVKWKDSIPNPGAPQNVQATNGTDDKVTITWNPVADATHYRVYMVESLTDIPEAISPWQEALRFEYQDMESNKPFYFYVKAAKSPVGTIPSDFSAPPVQGKRILASPQELNATDGDYSDSVIINWKASPYATHYRLYRSTQQDGIKEPITDWIRRLSFIDWDVEPHQPYYYWVQSALDEEGNFASRYSDEESGWATIALSSVSATDGDYSDRIKITWNKVKGASYYQLYRAESEDGAKNPISEWQQGNTFDDLSAAPGKQYYYWVSASNNSSGFDATGYSTPNTGWRNFAKPSGIKVSEGTYPDKVVISWNAVPGNPAYRIYMSENSTGAMDVIESGWMEGTEYEYSGSMPAGYTFYFAVSAVTDKNATSESELSNRASGWRYVPPPTNVQASDGAYTDQIHITWNAASSGSIYYKLFRADKANGTKYAITSWISNRYYFDRGLDPSESYYYYVKAAIDSSGTRASDYSRGNGGSTGLTPPENVNATKGTDTSKVAISWTRLSGTHYYRVYRADDIDGERTPINDWTAQILRYEDLNVRAGDIHYYWVKVAANRNGLNESAFSEMSVGYRYLPPPENIQASVGVYEGLVIITWDELPEATHYMVFRTDEPNGSRKSISGWQTETTFRDKDTIPGHTYYYTVKAAGSETGAGLSSHSQSNGGFSRMPPPDPIMASDGTYADKIRISWQSVENAQYFQVFRTEDPDNNELNPLNEFERITRFDDMTAEPGKIYYYSVAGARSQSGYGDTNISQSNSGFISPTVPQRPVVSNSEYGDKIVVSWPAIAEGVYYRVYRKDSPSGELAAIGNWQLETLYEDTEVLAGPTYYYAIQAGSNENGDRPSDIGVAYGGSRKMPPPSNLYVAHGADPNEILITWQKVENAVYYQLFRSDSLEAEKIPVTGWQRGTIFRDQNVEPLKIYYYWVKASRSFSGYKDTDLTAPEEGWLQPPAPTNVVVSNGEHLDKVNVQWDSTVTNGFYSVSRSEAIDGEKMLLGNWKPTLSFDDKEAVPGKTYYYWVQTSLREDGDGPSDFSDPVTGWKKMPAPEIPSQPNPANNSHDIDVSVNLDWNDSQWAERYYVQLWESTETEGALRIFSQLPDDPTFNYLTESIVIMPYDLKYDTEYSWQVTAENQSEIIKGPVWSFTTISKIDPTATNTPVSANMPTATNTPVATNTPTATYTPNNLPTLYPKPTNTPADIPTVYPRPTDTPTPTLTPTIADPTSTPVLQNPTPTPISSDEIIELLVNSPEPYLGHISSVSGADEDGDEDWYQFRPYTTGIHIIETHPVSGQDSMHTILYLYGPNDRTSLISFDYTSGYGAFSRISHVLDEGQTYYIMVIEEGRDATGHYAIDVITSIDIPTPVPVEPSPTPNLTGDCVEASDFYISEATGLLQVNLGSVEITGAMMADGNQTPLHIIPSDEPERLHIEIPWSEPPMEPATILFSIDTCGGNAPQQVHLYLHYEKPIRISTLNDLMIVASTEEYSPPESGQIQPIILKDPAGIRLIKLENSKIIIQKICWQCQAETGVEMWSNY